MPPVGLQPGRRANDLPRLPVSSDRVGPVGQPLLLNVVPLPLRIGISGSYGGMNIGDEAILQCILSQLREIVPAKVTVFSPAVAAKPKCTGCGHEVEVTTKFCPECGTNMR